MSRMSTLAVELRERRASCVVLQPMQPPRFYQSRAIALARVAVLRALGRPAFIFPEN